MDIDLYMDCDMGLFLVKSGSICNRLSIHSFNMIVRYIYIYKYTYTCICIHMHIYICINIFVSHQT
jgi:hypothetical protein